MWGDQDGVLGTDGFPGILGYPGAMHIGLQISGKWSPMTNNYKIVISI